MRLLILSDLHIELWRDDGPHVNLELAAPDVIILAGGIHTKSHAVQWAENKFPIAIDLSASHFPQWPAPRYSPELVGAYRTTNALPERYRLRLHRDLQDYALDR